MSTEKKVGFFFLLTLCVLAVMIELAEDWQPFTVQKEYRTYFDTAVGIKLGDPVRMAGVEVGKIRKIGIENSKVRIDFYVAEDTLVKEDSIAEIRQTNLLGGQFLGISFGSLESPPLAPDSAIYSKERVNIDQLITNLDRNQERVFGQMGELVEQSRDSIVNAASKLDSVLHKIDRGEGTLGRIVNDPGLYVEIEKTVAELNGLLVRLDKGEGTLGKLMTDSSLFDDAAVMVADLRTISDRLKNGQGTFGRLLVEDELYSNANDALINIREVAAKANNGTGALGKLVNDDKLYNEALATVERINSIATKIDNGDGTLGRLVNEDGLYRDATTTLHKVEKTVDGMSDSGPLSALGVVVGTMF
ncbi:MlaD family protein [Trichloromonas sp.]|uniref:MlaD family protein n=1 Tax=Trichloromonas sp. TaxID=3069249 RepID=UPI003D813B34